MIVRLINCRAHRLQHYDVFRLIAQHNLFDSVHDKILALMELDITQACALFLEHVDKISPDMVVSRLQNRPQLLFHVSKSIFTINSL